MYAIFREVDHEGAKAWLPVAVDEKGRPKGYKGGTRRQAIGEAIAAGDAELGGGPYWCVPASKIGEPENPKPKANPAIDWS